MQPVVEKKEITLTALLSLKDTLGWETKTILFSGEALADLLQAFSTTKGENLYHVLVGEGGDVRHDYTVRLNNRPIKQVERWPGTLRAGDRIVLAPIMKFAAGG